MYFSSLSPDGASISVAKLNGVYRTKILHNGDAKKNLRLENPSSIAVHPVNGFVQAVLSTKGAFILARKRRRFQPLKVHLYWSESEREFFFDLFVAAV